MAQINIKIEYNGHIDENLVNNILEISNLPKGKLLVLFSDDSLRKNFGICAQRSVMKFVKDTSLFNLYDNEKWDTAIAISRNTIELSRKYPTFFTYILGHELGHAHICLSSPELHVFCCLIYNFIKEGSNGIINQCHELPHENLFDRFGVYILESLFSKEQFVKEVGEMLQLEMFKNDPWLEKLLMLSGVNSICVDELRNNLIQYSTPYRDNLIRLWRKDIENCRKEGLISLAELIKDYDDLFDKEENIL